MDKNTKRLGLIFLFGTLVACGGSGSPAPAPVPAPSPTALATPVPVPSPTASPVACSRSDLEAQLNTQLEGLSSDEDFAFYLERASGENFSYARGTVDMQSLLESASTSKFVTATAILRLVDKGKLNLSSKVSDYLPSWPLASDPTLSGITLEQLLSFSSGLHEEPICLNLPNADFFSCVNTIGSDNAGSGVQAGSDFYYASTHLQVAGAMAVKAAGYSDWSALFADFKSETGLFPNSAYDLPSSTNPRLAGGMHWSGEDYSAFLRKTLHGELLSDNLQAIALQDHSAGLTIAYSPVFEALGEQWHYGFGFWHECADASFSCDPAETISSPGAYGAYPFINFSLHFFGLVARQGMLGTFPEGLRVYREVQSTAEKWAACDSL